MRTGLLQRLLCLVGTILGFALAGCSGKSPAAPSSTSASTSPAGCQLTLSSNQAVWTSAGKSVTGFIMRPQGAGPFPAVIVLHTSGGFGSLEQSMVSFLAENGYVALAPDYFTPEGITAQTFDVSITLTTYVDRIREHVSGGIECLRSQSYVDTGRLASVGSSLGGYFGLLAGARDDVKAVVSYYGAYHGEGASMVSTKYSFTDVAAQLKARVLMFHGEADAEVNIRLAQNAQRTLVEAGRQSELVVYPGVGHRFDRVGAPTYNAQAAADARARTLSFLP